MREDYLKYPSLASTGDFTRSSFYLTDNVTREKYDSLIHCFIKGLIVFAGAYGTITGVLSEFDVIYDYASVFFTLLLVSMLLAIIHIKRALFNVGYIGIFVIFTSGVFRYRLYVNSGFQALLNIVNEAYGKHFLLLFTRESTEVISDRFQTVTAAAIFIGVFLAILINVALFQGIMDTFSLFFLTILPLFLGIYIGKYPAFIPVTFIFFSLFASLLLGHNGHYHFIREEKQKELTEYSLLKYVYDGKIKRRPKGDRGRFRRKKEYIPEEIEVQRTIFFHKSNARHMAGLCIVALLLALAVSFMSAILMNKSEAEAMLPPEVKEDADEYVKLFVQNGFAGMFNRYNATGGLSNGRLGGVSGVRPSYTPNLYVTFVPYAYETVYLRAFAGQYYNGNSFTDAKRNTSYLYNENIGDRKQEYNEYIGTAEGQMIDKLMDNGEMLKMHGKMLVENAGAGNNHIYLPYYTDVKPEHCVYGKDGAITGVLRQTPLDLIEKNDDEAMTISYVPYSEVYTGVIGKDKVYFDALKSEEEKEFFDLYTEEVYENYLQIPEDLKPTLEEVKSKIGEGSKDDLESLTYEIYGYFLDNYTYSLSPGTTPVNEDFVRYFLTEQNAGYCAHFAAASTMLFRSYGIPARYCEGYVATQSDVTDRAQGTDYDRKDFFEGESPLGELPVVNVELTDGEAHAWTEVFVDGFGWVIVDNTVPSEDEETTSYSDFMLTMSSIFGADTGAVTENDGTDDNSGIMNDLFSSLSPAGSPLVFTLLVILVLVIAFPFIKMLLIMVMESIRVKKAYKTGRYDVCIEKAYGKLYRKIRKQRPADRVVLPEDVERVLNELNCEHSEGLIEMTEKIIYSPYTPDKKKADEILKEYKELKRKKYRKR